MLYRQCNNNSIINTIAKTYGNTVADALAKTYGGDVGKVLTMYGGNVNQALSAAISKSDDFVSRLIDNWNGVEKTGGGNGGIDKIAENWYGTLQNTDGAGTASSWDDTIRDALGGNTNTGYNGIAGAGETFTQGSKIPDDVLQSKPLYSPDINRWLENGGKITIDNEIWKYTNSQGISVTYINGYPDFKGSGFVQQEVDIGPFRNRSADFRLADKIAPNGPISPDNTWHHNEDGRTLQEVDKDIHKCFTHRGGISGMKKQ